MVALDQVEHQVEGGDAARAGDPIVLDLEEGAHDLDIRVAFLEGGNMLPVERATAPRQQTRTGEQVRPSGNAAERDPPPGEMAKPSGQGWVVEGGGISPRTDEDTVGVELGVADIDIRQDRNSVGSLDGASARCRMPPAVDFAFQKGVGRPHGLDRGRVGHERKARQQDEADGQRRRLFRCRGVKGEIGQDSGTLALEDGRSFLRKLSE